MKHCFHLNAPRSEHFFSDFNQKCRYLHPIFLMQQILQLELIYGFMHGLLNYRKISSFTRPGLLCVIRAFTLSTYNLVTAQLKARHKTKHNNEIHHGITNLGVMKCHVRR